MAAGASGVFPQDEAAVAVGTVDEPVGFQIEEHARMAERATAPVARNDRVVDLDDFGRIDGHGLPLILSSPFGASI